MQVFDLGFTLGKKTKTNPWKLEPCADIHVGLQAESTLPMKSKKFSSRQYNL